MAHGGRSFNFSSALLRYRRLLSVSTNAPLLRRGPNCLPFCTYPRRSTNMTHHQSREPRGQCTMSFNALVSLHTPPTPRPTFLNAKRHTSVFYHFTHCVVVVSLGNMHHDYALDTMTLGVWYPPMLSFALWWLVQVGLASAALGEARAQLAPVQLPAEEIGEPPDRTSRGTDWLTRLSVTNEVARDSFLMLFTTAVIISLVGADNVLAILAWSED
ncbi:hypothetical protein BDZ88DRAFT_330149 [Geranomyces variabilis]|nr:hypothetical protein BDZ88DRAFT_330149 [Geranomyces variabilis]